MRMAPIFFEGGPADGANTSEGSWDLLAGFVDGRLSSIVLTHVNCACVWCADVEGNAVEHVYDRRDDEVFVYRESGAPELAGWGRWTPEQQRNARIYGVCPQCGDPLFGPAEQVAKCHRC